MGRGVGVDLSLHGVLGHPLQLMRVLWSLQRKKGGYATAQFSNGTIIGRAGNNVQVDSDKDDFLVETAPGQLTFNLVMNDLIGMKLQRVSRALPKRLREAVFDKPHRGYIVLPEQVTPDGGPLQMSYIASDDDNGAILSARLAAYGRQSAQCLATSYRARTSLASVTCSRSPNRRKLRR